MIQSGGSSTPAAGSITLAMLANMVTDRLLGRDTAGTGVPEALAVGGGVEFTGSGGIQRSALTGDVTASAGSDTTAIANDAVTLAKMADMATASLLGRSTAGTGDPEVLSAATARTLLGLGTAGLVGSLPASGVSAGSTYEVATDLGGNKCLQLKRYTNYPIARSSALSGAEWGRTWDDAGNLDSADQNTTTANAFRWNLNGTASDWTTGAKTAPSYHWTVRLNAGDRLIYTVRVASNADATHELAGIGITLDSSQATFSLLRLGYSTVTPGVQVDDSVYSPVGASVTTGQRAVGVWLRVVVDESGIHHYYNVADQLTPPTGAWPRIRTPNVSTTAQWWIGQLLRVGLTAMTANTSNNFEVDFLYEDVQFESGERGRTGIQWGAVLLDTTATEQLIGEQDFGVAVSLDQATLRLLFADAVNRRAGDTATVTFSVVGSATTAPASGTYYAADSLVVSGSYRYWRVYYKVSSDGTTQGSVALPLPLPVSA